MNELTSIVVIITIYHANTNFFFLFRMVSACSVICSTLVAELMAASASHMVAALVLLDPKLALSALLCSRSIEPLEECLIASIVASFNLSLLFFPTSSYLILQASLALVIDGLTCEAIRNLATWAVMALKYFFLAKAVKVAVVCRAFEVVTRLSIPDHLPFMASPADQFLQFKNSFKVSVP